MYFLQPQFLYLLGLGLVPLIIHLLTRLRLRRQNFPSLLLLQSVRRERFSWVRLKEILLLLIRTLFLLLIPLALSRPGLKTALPVRIGTDRVLIILDDSYSMSYGRRWSIAVNTCRQIIHNSHRPWLLLTSRTDTLITGKNSISRLLDTIKPSAGAWTLQPALTTAESLCRASPLPVVLITDLQQRAVPENGFQFTAGKLWVFNFSNPVFDNAGITEVSLHNNRLQAEIANYGSNPVTRTITLKMENHREQQTVNLAPRSRATIDFPVAFNQPGIYTGSLELSPDSLPIDDVRFFAFDIPSRITVPIFVSANVPGKYLQLALLSDTVHFQPLLLNSAELRRTDLSGYPVIIIADAGALSPADFDRLDFYLSSGGGLLLCIPALPGSGIERLLPAGGPVNLSGFVTPREVDTTHPLLAGFRTGDFTGVRIFRHTRLAGARTLIRLADQDPLILELPEKNLIAWSFAPEPEATDLIYKAVFVPLLHQTIKYLTNRAFRNQWLVGDTVRLTVPALQPLRLVLPAGEKTVIPEPSLPRPELLITDTRLPGIYQLENHSRRAFAVNPLPEEGDLTPASNELLNRRGIKNITPGVIPGGELTGPLLYLAALLLTAELLITGLENYRKIPVRK